MRSREFIYARIWTRLKEYVEISPSCWLWRSTLGKDGYGRFHVGRAKRYLAHRFIYELLKGPIPAGKVCDHLCRNPACVNPDHIEPVTNKENVLRGVGITARLARKTHCSHGHEYTPENTWWYYGIRYCRTCDRAREKRRRIGGSNERHHRVKNG